MAAISSNQFMKVEEMLKEHPDLIYSRNQASSTPFQVACYRNAAETLDTLKAVHPKLDFASACVVGATKDVEQMLKKNPKLANERVPDGVTPLALAAGYDHPDTVELLLKYHADPLKRSTRVGRSDHKDLAPIHGAVFHGCLSCLKLLVEHGADVNMTQAGRYTPLDEASENGNLDIVKYLVGHGAKVNAKDDDGKTAVDIANENGHPDVVKFLASKGGKPGKA